MATIENALQLTSGMTTALARVDKSIVRTRSGFESLRDAYINAFSTNVIQMAQINLNKSEIVIINIGEGLEQAKKSQEELNDSAKKSEGIYEKISKKIKGAVFSQQNIKKVLEYSDQMVNTRARLDIMNDGLQTTEELQNKVFQAAQRSRTSYKDTVAVVSELGLKAKNAFSNNNQAIAFAELMNQHFKLGCAPIEDQKKTMEKLVDAMASGNLKGNEFITIMETAPILAEAIADKMGKSIEEMSKLTSESSISADIIKEAMFSTADEVRVKFSQLPMTWADLWTKVSNAAGMFFQPILNGLNWIAENINIIAPLVLGLGSAFLVFLLAANWINITTAVAKGFQAAQTLLSIGFGIITGNSAAASAAVFKFNSALLASPITWIIMLFMVLVGLIYAVVAAINHFAGTSISATGIIMGAFATLLAFIANVVMGALEIVFGVEEAIINVFAMLANFFGNLFNDPIGAIIKLFYDLADIIIGIIEKIASALDFIFGTQMADSLKDFRADIRVQAEEIAKTGGNGTYQERVSKMDISEVLDNLGLSMERYDYTEAFNAGYSLGEKIDSKIGNLFSGGANNLLDEFGLSNQLDDIYYNGTETATNTASMADSMKSSEEELQYLRDLAEQEVINRFTTAEIKVDMTNHNNISSEMDLDGIVTYLEDKLYETMVIASEGVHV